MSSTKATVLQKLDDLNQALEALFTTLDQYTEEQLNQAPQPGAWSALQAMEHLMLSEKLALQYCQKKLSFDPKLAPAGIGTTLRSKAVLYYEHYPIKVKAPKMVSSDAFPDRSVLADVKTNWRNQRAALHEFLQQQPDSRYGQEVFKHPFAGRLHYSGMLDFFLGHFRRHRRQAIRALK